MKQQDIEILAKTRNPVSNPEYVEHLKTFLQKGELPMNKGDLERLITAIREDERKQAEADFAAWVHEYANSKYGSPEAVIEAYKSDTERA